MSWVIGVSFVIRCKEPFHHTCVYANEMTQGGPSDSHKGRVWPPVKLSIPPPISGEKRLEIWVQLPIARDLINYANAVKPGYNSLNKEIQSTSCLAKHDMTGGWFTLDSMGTEASVLGTLLNLALCTFTPSCSFISFIRNYNNKCGAFFSSVGHSRELPNLKEDPGNLWIYNWSVGVQLIWRPHLWPAFEVGEVL